MILFKSITNFNKTGIPIKELIILSLAVVSTFEPIHYFSRAFSIDSSLPDFIWIPIFIIVSDYLLSGKKIKKIKEILIDKNSMLIFIVVGLLFIQENFGYIFFNQSYGYHIFKNLFWFGAHYFLIHFIIKNYDLDIKLALNNIYLVFISVLFVISSITVIYILLFPIFNFELGSYIIRSSKIAFLGPLGVYLLLFYRPAIRTNNILMLILFSSTPLLMTKVGPSILVVGLYGFWILTKLGIKRYFIFTVTSVLLLTIFFSDYLKYTEKYYNCPLTQDECLDPPLVVRTIKFSDILYGFSTEDANALTIREILNEAGQLQSTYVRNRINRLALDEFSKNIIFGAGEYKVRNDSRFIGYYTHTYLIYIAASFGIIGLFAIVYLFYNLIAVKQKKIELQKDMLAFSIFSIGLFMSVIPFWLVVPLILNSSEQETE